MIPRLAFLRSASHSRRAQFTRLPAAGAALCLFAASAGFGATYNVSTAADLTTKLGIVNAGDTIVLANGTYAGNFTLDRVGNAGAPISIIPANPNDPNRAKFTGRIFLKNVYAVLGSPDVAGGGFRFENGGVNITGSNNHVTRNLFYNGTGTYPAVFCTEGASNNRVSYNEVTAWHKYGMRVVDYSPGATGNRLDHNYIHDSNFNPPKTEPGGEAIQLGTGRNESCQVISTLVEYNLIVNVDTDEDGEIISVKSSGNTIRYNTIKSCGDIGLTLRQGNSTRVEANWLYNQRIRVYGDDHVVIGNRIIGYDLEVMAGDSDKSCPDFANGHANAKRQWIAGNIIDSNKKVIVGAHQYSGYPAVDNKIWGNKYPDGSAATVDMLTNPPPPTPPYQTGTITNTPYTGSIGVAFESPPSAVGPSAPPESAGAALIGHWKLDETTGKVANRVGHWKFNETSGTSATDSSGGVNTGVLAGFSGTFWVAGQIGNGLAFDGVMDDVRIYNRVLTGAELQAVYRAGL
jgi:poly(beta-D-mannuronate) lyase